MIFGRNTTSNRKATGINNHYAKFVTDLESLIQADKIQTILGAAKVQEVEPIWATIFAKVNT
jgi:flagellar biosynthesis chaperone FliJ